MKRPYLLCFLIFCAVADRLFGQPAPDNNYLPAKNAKAIAWETTRQSIILFSNTDDNLPLKNLGERWLSYQSFGLGDPNIFEETLNKYYPEPPPRKLVDTSDFKILGINGDSIMEGSADWFEIENQLLQYGPKHCVAVIFGEPFTVLKLLVKRDGFTVMVVPKADDIGQSIAAQLIFGGCAASGLSNEGRMQSELPPVLRQYNGLTTTKATRLGYAPPELVGLDGQLLADSIRAIVEEGIRAQAFPGAQVLVAKDGVVVFHETYGFHTYDSLQPVRHDDLYDFASVTKVTSTLPALMRLYGEGKFDLDAPLKEYLPMFKKSDKAEVAYRQLLAHNGRLKPSIVFWREAKNEDGTWKRRSFRSTESRRYPIRITDSLFLHKNYKRQIYKGIRDLPLNQKPGYVYSDLSFILYPAVVERLSGETLETYLNETFYKPLGATTLTFNPLSSYSKERILPTERDTFFRKQQVHGTVHDETAAMLGGVSGHAGLFGTTGDLAKLVQMYLNGGEYGGERFISEAAMREFTRCQFCGEGNRRGLGFDKPLIEYDSKLSYVAKSASPESFGHSGYTGTFFWADPKHNLMVIFLSNRVYPDRSHTGIMDLNIRPRVHQVVYDALR